MWVLAAVAAPVLLAHLVFYKEFLFVSFDQETARTLGYQVTRWNLLLYLTLGVVITSAMQFAGVMLVFIPAIGMFAITDLMGGARVPMVGNVIQNQFGQARDWPFGAALGMTILLLFAASFWLSMKTDPSTS